MRLYKAHIRGDGTVQELADHLTAVSSLASQYSGKIGLGEFGKITGLLHDYGKYNDLFQRYLESGTGNLKNGDSRYVDYIKLKGKIDHSTAGAQKITDLEIGDLLITHMLQIVIASHHGGLIDFINTEGETPFLKRMEKEIEKLSPLIEVKDPDYLELLKRFSIENELKAQFYQHLEKLKSLGDKEILMYMLGLTIKFLFSCLVDADRTDTADFENPERLIIKDKNRIDWEELEKIFNNHINNFKRRNVIDDYRNKVSNECFEKGKMDSGIYRLTVPTGGGKTLASFRFALEHVKRHQMDRIFYIVPYTSIIDQNAQTLRDIFDKGGYKDVILEHHSNLTPEENTEINQIAGENWDAPIVYTTMVQFLETLFSGGTRSVRRFHQLANSVIIFDEIQTLGIKNVFMFNLAVKYLTEVCKSTIILCTATQPVLDSEELNKYGIKIDEDKDITADITGLEDTFKRVNVHNYTNCKTWEIENTVDLIEEQFCKEKSVLVIANTKKAALTMANLVKNKGHSVYHLSTSMCPTHRLEVLDEVRKKLLEAKQHGGKQIICISTQLIEAGVDVDFDVVIRHLAGLDSIVQAAGRCNRNGLLTGYGDLFIVDPLDESLGKLEDIKKGKEISKRVISEFEEDKKTNDGEVDLLSSKYMERYFELYFYQRKDEMDYPVDIKESGTKDNILNLLSTNVNAVNAMSRRDNRKLLPFAFKTAGKYYKAIDSITRGVIVPYEKGKDVINRLCSSANPREISDLLRRAQKYSINLFEFQLDSLFKEGYIHETQEGSGILYLLEGLYDNYGLNVTNAIKDIIF